jgi:hypothetical protein
MSRRAVPAGADRRWIEAQLVVPGAPSEVALRLLRGCGDRRRQWDRLGRAAGRGVDQVAAEGLVWELVDRGLARVHQRRARNGDWEPYQWELSPSGLSLLPAEFAPAPDVSGYLARSDPADQPLLASIRMWLEASPTASVLDVSLVLAVGEELRAGRQPRGRLLAVQVGGHTKALRVTDHREALEAAFGGFALEEVIRLHGRAVLSFGAFRFRVNGHWIDGRWSRPWLALTPETLQGMEELEVGARRVLTIENLVAFEEESRQGVPADTVLVYTGGFPGALERAWLERLIEGGVEQVEHWGDLDLGGLRILRHLGSIVSCPVRPYRMEPTLLDRLPTRPLSPRDRVGLAAWLNDPEAPLRDLAVAMLERGVKAEQEGWFLPSPR